MHTSRAAEKIQNQLIANPYMAHSYVQLEAVQRWSAICCMWPWTMNYQKFLLCLS